MKKNSLWKDLLLIVGIGLIVFLLIFFQRDKFHRIKLGSPAPDFKLMALDGREVALSDYRGKVVLLNFWATWCSPCKEEIPSLNALYTMLHKEGLEILAVSEDNRGLDAVKPFVDRYNIIFPVLLDPSRKVGTLYSIGGVPETFLIDRNGIVRYKFVGPKNWTSASIVSFIRNYLR